MFRKEGPGSPLSSFIMMCFGIVFSCSGFVELLGSVGFWVLSNWKNFGYYFLKYFLIYSSPLGTPVTLTEAACSHPTAH